MRHGSRGVKGEAVAKAPGARKVHQHQAAKVYPAEPSFAETSAQLAAISEILRVMSASPGDVKPVLDAVAERAAHLCEAPFATVWLADGDMLRPGAAYSLDGTQRTPAPLPLKRSIISGRAMLDRVTIHYQDVAPLLDTEYPDAINARPQGMRAVLSVPLMRANKAYGAIFLFRREPRPFTRDRIALVETFARQAAIAIENVRLFDETKEALERQSASAEVLAAISGSIADTVPVFDRILASCEHLFAGKIVGINVVGEDGLLRVAAYQGQGREEVEKTYSAAIDDESAGGVAMIRHEVLHFPMWNTARTFLR